jgi:small subunit ribosomal protein S6
MTPVLSEDQAAETVDKFKKYLEDQGAKISFESDWGLRKLAYPIQKKTTGFYYLLEFEAEGDAAGSLETVMKRDERVLRWLTTRMDKHHAKYADGRRDKQPKKQPAKTETKSS